MFWRALGLLLAVQWGVSAGAQEPAPQQEPDQHMIQRYLNALANADEEAAKQSVNEVAEVFLPSRDGDQIPIYKLAPKLFPSLRMEPLPPVDTTASCEQMYLEVTRLTELSRRRHPGFYDDPRNQAVFVSAALFPATVYFWGYTALEGQFDQRRTAMVKDRIRDLRAALADKLCFVR